MLLAVNNFELYPVGYDNLLFISCKRCFKGSENKLNSNDLYFKSNINAISKYSRLYFERLILFQKKSNPKISFTFHYF